MLDITGDLDRPSETESACWAPPGARSASSLLVLLLLAVTFGFACALVWSPSAAEASSSVVFRGPSDQKCIALTFDDNTIGAPSIATLQVLREYAVPTTLFVTGHAISALPDLTMEILRGVNDGLFEVGDHSGTHCDLTVLPRDGLALEIGAGTDAFRRDTGAATVPLFRPPYGRFNSLVAEVAQERGFSHVVLWDVGTEDWTGEPAQTIEQNIVSRAHNGAIVLLHMSAPNTAAALPGIITRLRAAGYKLVTVSALLHGARLFADVDPSTEVGRAVERVYAAGIMSGYNGERFGPTNSITRAQVAKVLTLAAGVHTTEIEHPDTPSFSDVSPKWDAAGNLNPYPYDFVEEAVTAGLVEGMVDSQGTPLFQPGLPIARIQLAQVVARMARQFKGYPDAIPGDGATFADIPDYAEYDVRLVSSLGLMTGRSANSFDSWQPARRGQVAVVLSRFLDLAPYDPEIEAASD